MEATINIDRESFNIENENIYSIIYLKINNISFPDKKWNDFVVIIMNWWLEEILNYVKGFSKEIELQFMDGPFLLKITNDQLKWIISLQEKDKIQNISVPRKTVENLFNSIIVGSEVILNKLENMGISNRDIELLKEKYTECKSLLNTKFS